MHLLQRLTVVLALCLLLPSTGIKAQQLPDSVKQEIGEYLLTYALQVGRTAKIRIDSVAIEKKTLKLYTKSLDDFPFREKDVANIYAYIRSVLPSSMKSYTPALYTSNRLIEDLIPLALRSKPNKKIKHFTPAGKVPLVTPLSRPYTPDKGLQNRHIAMWQSHGYYYEQKLTRWEWQRGRLMQTVEDLYTQSYVLPFLVPMLENAGANVLLPRERDTRRQEVIVDNDTIFSGNSIYSEQEEQMRWQQGEEAGFAQRRAQYTDFENPFREGTYRTIETIKKGKASTASWIPDIPETGEYAVYVSYKSLPESTTDALYTVNHLGGSTSFKVNQQMGGGTWIYLGTFGFPKGKSIYGVELSNLSSKAGRIVTADAVKIGGGMGNIARKVSPDGLTANIRSSETVTHQDSVKMPELVYPYEVSGYPRFCEAARYWLQWAGIPDSIYSESNGRNDYTDDYRCRGLWVNYLAGGSASNPNEKGLNIPVDLAFAFHTDAGTTLNDSIIGTLGIYMTKVYDGVYANGASRNLARDLTDLIQSQIVNDVRSLYEPKWTRRGMWNQSYFEARVPRVPTMLLELLSHQNFADMRYGLDPRFRFTVSRAIYKGMLRFLASQYKTDYVVQPLPVDHLALHMISDNEVEVTWQSVADPLEPTATAESYIVYTRIGDGDFDNGTAVQGTRFQTTIPAGVVCSYKVTAVNRGGESFPSEILSAGRATNTKGTVLIVNGFDRVSAPADFVMPAPLDTLFAGFLDEIDHGMPYLKDIHYVGKMKVYDRRLPWTDDDAGGFGDSYGNYETMVIAGNTFDYPAVHGTAILQNGYSFVSCSNESVESKSVNLSDYKYVDLILGKQAQAKMGRGDVCPLEFKTFNTAMQDAITAYCKQGGNIFVSGAYVGTDLWQNPLAPSLKSDCQFATDVLKYKWRNNRAAVNGHVHLVLSPYTPETEEYTYYNELNEESYAVESPDAIEPAGKGAYTILRYAENNLSAGTAYKGDYRTVVMGFPFEALRTAKERETMMLRVLNFFNSK
jgi:hypothetical protein